MSNQTHFQMSFFDHPVLSRCVLDHLIQCFLVMHLSTVYYNKHLLRELAGCCRYTQKVASCVNFSFIKYLRVYGSNPRSNSLKKNRFHLQNVACSISLRALSLAGTSVESALEEGLVVISSTSGDYAVALSLALFKFCHLWQQKILFTSEMFNNSEIVLFLILAFNVTKFKKLAVQCVSY